MVEPLEIHIAGNEIGESISLRLPDGKWGVVDVYVPVLATPSSSPMFRLLQARGVSTLEFLCMTHADSDHYRVKVSHHGSTTGYCRDLWENHLSPRRSAVAVITAYTKQRLPRKEGLDHIKAWANWVFTTSKAAIKCVPNLAGGATSRKSVFRRLAPAVVTALEATFSSARLKSTHPQGICSFIFDDQGNFEHQLSGDATEL